MARQLRMVRHDLRDLPTLQFPTVLRNNSHRPAILLMPAILVLGCGIRLIGIGVGLPNTPDPRETLIAADILNLINFTAPPEIYNWPGTAWFYLIAFAGKVLSIFGLEMTVVRVIWIARVFNVLLSTSTIWFTYSLGSQCFNKRVGQIAAGFLAVSMLHATNESRFALVDIPATFCVTLFLWCVARDTQLTLRTCLWLGIIAGIGVAVKFTTVFVGLSLLVFIRTENFFRKFATIFGLAAFTFTLICPYWLYDLFSSQWNYFFDDFWYEAGHYHLGHFGLFSTGDIGWGHRFLYLWTLLRWGLGVPLAFLVSIGIIHLLSKSMLLVKPSSTEKLFTEEKVRQGLMLLAFVIPYLLFIGSFKVSFTRHLLILYPVFSVVAAVFLVSIYRWLGIIYGSLVWFYSLVYTVAFASVLLTQPTGQEVSDWVSENIPHDETIAHAPEVLFTWLIPELDRDVEVGAIESEWVLIIQPNWQVFEKYRMNPQYYEKIDWYPLEDIEIDNTVQFYDSVLGEDRRYILHKTFRRVPRFFAFSFSASNAPFPMQSLTHPEIRIYRLNE